MRLAIRSHRRSTLAGSDTQFVDQEAGPEACCTISGEVGQPSQQLVASAQPRSPASSAAISLSGLEHYRVALVSRRAFQVTDWRDLRRYIGAVGSLPVKFKRGGHLERPLSMKRAHAGSLSLANKTAM